MKAKLFLMIAGVYVALAMVTGLASRRFVRAAYRWTVRAGRPQPVREEGE